MVGHGILWSWLCNRPCEIYQRPKLERRLDCLYMQVRVTVWKFQKFSATKILREIIFEKSRCAKSGILTAFWHMYFAECKRNRFSLFACHLKIDFRMFSYRLQFICYDLYRADCNVPGACSGSGSCLTSNNQTNSFYIFPLRRQPRKIE